MALFTLFFIRMLILSLFSAYNSFGVNAHSTMKLQATTLRSHVLLKTLEEGHGDKVPPFLSSSNPTLPSACANDDGFSFPLRNQMSCPSPSLAGHKDQSQLFQKLMILICESSSKLVVIAPTIYEIIRNQVSKIHGTNRLPSGSSRWAIAHPETNLTGTWRPIITAQFKIELDVFLSSVGQSYFVRKVAINALSLHREVIVQTHQGRELEILSTNPMGSWLRTIIASGSDLVNFKYNAFNSTIREPGGGTVEIQAWWEGQGKIHRSLLIGSARAAPGIFDSSRFIDDEGVLNCITIYRPISRHEEQHIPNIVWRFSRDEDIPGLERRKP